MEVIYYRPYFCLCATKDFMISCFRYCSPHHPPRIWSGLTLNSHRPQQLCRSLYWQCSSTRRSKRKRKPNSMLSWVKISSQATLMKIPCPISQRSQKRSSGGSLPFRWEYRIFSRRTMFTTDIRYHLDPLSWPTLGAVYSYCYVENFLIRRYRSMLHDENVYPDPFEFKPERFLKDGKLDPSVQDPGVAFGFGRRIW